MEGEMDGAPAVFSLAGISRDCVDPLLLGGIKRCRPDPMATHELLLNHQEKLPAEHLPMVKTVLIRILCDLHGYVTLRRLTVSPCPPLPVAPKAQSSVLCR